MLEEILRENFLPCLINVITVIYIIKKLLNQKINFKLPVLYIMILGFTAVTIANYKLVDNNIRFLSSTFITILFSYVIFDCEFNKIVFASIVEQIIIFVSEFISALVIILFKLYNFNIFDVMGTLSTIFLICIIAIILINNKRCYSFCLKLMNIMIGLKFLNKCLIVLFLFLTINILLAAIYMSNDLNILFINAFFIVTYSFIVYMLINERNQNLIVKKENQALISNLNEYEKMLDYQRISNHENKNQLLVIKGIIDKDSSEASKYIDEIIKEKREDDEVLFTKTKRIPSGGLQGLIYQKMLVMQENKIEINLNISKDIRKIDFSSISSKTNYDICRIVGIILDNAIEETVKFDVKEREILISMYIDEDFVIEIANNFVDNIDLDKIFNKGYTTKSEGHGYGLSLLKKIVNENKDITNETKIINNLFVQTVKIKITK